MGFFVLWLGPILGLVAQQEPEIVPPPIDAPVLTNMDAIWQLPQVEQQRWHRVRLEYVVYYYDPLWHALWGRCGEAESYLSLGAKTFPIKVGQRIQVQGLMRPAQSGMRVEQAEVKWLEESVPLTPLPTKGRVGSTALFSKKYVWFEGYVDKQTIRDANHVDLTAIAEGRTVFVQLQLKNDGKVPQFRDKFIRAKGVYFARAEEGSDATRIEVWVQRPEDIEAQGELERDPRFELPATPLNQLSGAPADRVVHVTGKLAASDAGRSLTLRDGNALVVVETAQTIAAEPGEELDAAGFVARAGDGWVLREALVRPAQAVMTSIAQIWGLPVAERQKRQRVQLDLVVYHYDPVWNAVWGRAGGSDDYLSFGSVVLPLKQGQRVRVEGSVLAMRGMTIEDPKVTVLEESVPLEALSTQGHIGETERFNKRMTFVEGYVDRQTQNDAQHLSLNLVVEGRLVLARVFFSGAPEKLPQWENARLRLRGVYSATTDPTGGPPAIEIWTMAPENVQVLGWLDEDGRFDLPATPIERLERAPPDRLVRIVGAARTQQPGKSLTIRDESGQIALDTPQMRAVQLGEAVEAVGYPVRQNNELRLRGGLFRRLKGALPPPPEGLPRLRLADQLRELPPDEAARGYPVELTGTVTWAHPSADFIYISDATGGVRVYPPDTKSLWAGARVFVSGASAAGRFTPVVLAQTVYRTATIELPDPRRVTLEQALTGVEEGQWVSMTGFVRDVKTEGPWVRLELTTSAGEFAALVPPSEALASCKDAVVRVRGVCSAIANEKHQLTGIQLWVPSAQYLEIEEAAPADPFAAPARPIASLRQFSSLQRLNHRVRVAGVVVHHESGRLIHIQDGNEGLLVLSRGTTPLAPGDRIEAVGFPGRENSRAVLREAVYRRTATGPEPAPVAIRDLAAIDADLDGRLVRVESVLLDVHSQERGLELVNQQGGVVFEASLGATRAALPEDLVSGSRLALTGVYEIEFDEYRRPHEARLQLRSPADIAVLRRPSRWTVRRVLAITGVLAIGVVLGLGWVAALRRRVREQTGVIREQFEKEKAARLEAALTRASKLESLGVLAGGIAHDFNNLLTVIIGNVSLAKLDPKAAPDTVHCLKESERAALRARDLTQQLLTFAKGGEPMRAATRLPDVVREAAQFALHGAKARPEFEIAPDLWAADVDKGQIGQVVHNIIINASQAMPAGGSIRVVLRNEEIADGGRAALAPGRYVKMSFTDTGSGIGPELLPRIFEPYFTTKQQGSGLGLATVYSIVKKHQGHIEVTSVAGQGTTFHVWLPAAPLPANVAGAEPSAAPDAPRVARVLLMDDEAPIRLLGSAVLKRMGFAVTAVRDGAAALSEYAAASAAGRPFDLVILDLTVPGGMGGAEAMEKLRGIDPQVRAIVSSGYSSDPVMANYRAHGFCGRVPKPYAANDLAETVSRVLTERRNEGAASFART
jgi:signal transduction histidine kinase/CheY-like chemotaxis protein